MEIQEEEIEQLREENRLLGEQVKDLVQMERRLHNTKRSLGQQVRRVRALNTFSLNAANALNVLEVFGDALDLLLSVYPFHQAFAIVKNPEADRWSRIDKRPRTNTENHVDIEFDGAEQFVANLASDALFWERSDDQAMDKHGALLESIQAIAPEDGGYQDWRAALLLTLTDGNGEFLGYLWAINCATQDSRSAMDFDLDNNSMVDVFRRHLVVALENLHFHAQLEERVRTRTMELGEALKNLERTNEQLEYEMADRVEMERALARSQKLESLGELTASLGHEINNPLTYLMANLKFVCEQLETPKQRRTVNTAELIEALEEATEGAERIAHLVRDIKQFSLDQDVDIGPVDLGKVVEGAMKLAGKRVRHIAELRSRSFAGLPLVAGQTGLLEQVVVNLLLNAVDAIAIDTTSDDKNRHEITIDARQLDDQRVELCVSDTGCGIPSDELEKVFDPFYSTKFGSGGSGLGLFVCHTLIDSIDGSIELESTVGEGTTVRLQLPISDSFTLAEESTEVSAIKPQFSAKARILIVDDEESIVRLFERWLPEHETVALTSGRQALKAYKDEPFDLVFCDLMMPRFSGRDFYHGLRALGPQHTKRVVFVTGGAFIADDQKFLNDIPNQCLQKPVDRSQVREIVNES